MGGIIPLRPTYGILRMQEYELYLVPKAKAGHKFMS
jgi:hypothetical protein